MEGRVQIVDEGLFHFSCCHNVGDSTATGKGESIKLWADGIGWSWGNEGDVRTLGLEKTMLSLRRIIYIYI